MNRSKTLHTLLLSVAILFAAISSARAAFTIQAPSGTFQGEERITLSRHDVDLRTTRQILVTRSAQDGSLQIQSEEEAGIYVLKSTAGQEITLAPSSGETITVKLHAGSLLSSGSPGSKTMQEYERFRKASLARLVYPVRADIRQAKQNSASEEEIVRLTQAEVDAYKQHLAELNDFVIENAGDSLALYGTSLRWDTDYRSSELEELVDRFAEKHGEISATRSLQKRIQTAKRVAIGAVAPNVAGNNLEGERVSLKSYRGRYVLVDFWASWCPPCRLENQHYQSLIKKVPETEFTIFAINLDTHKRLWATAVSRDKADWVHISDLEGWTSELAAIYGVTALPASFLLDPEGRIIAKDLRGHALDNKLKELELLD